MEVHSVCPLGIFISLNTNIVGGKQEFFYTEFSSSNQLLIYIQQFNNYDPSTLFSILDSLIDIAILLNSKCSSIETDSNLQTKVDSIKPLLQTQINNIANIAKELNNHTKFIIDSIQKNNNSIKGHLDALKYSITSIFQTLFQNLTDTNTIESSEEQPPPKKKQYRRKNVITENHIIIDAT